jgi:predicted nucleic acid-binding protein
VVRGGCPEASLFAVGGRDRLEVGELLAGLRAAGRAMPIKDSLIAATAIVRDLTVVARNRVDFERAGLSIIDPFG